MDALFSGVSLAIHSEREILGLRLRGILRISLLHLFVSSLFFIEHDEHVTLRHVVTRSMKTE
jgi:hypothetical protein